jgi:transcriptional regulator with XRE-family HTH domain
MIPQLGQNALIVFINHPPQGQSSNDLPQLTIRKWSPLSQVVSATHQFTQGHARFLANGAQLRVAAEARCEVRSIFITERSHQRVRTLLPNAAVDIPAPIVKPLITLMAHVAFLSACHTREILVCENYRSTGNYCQVALLVKEKYNPTIPLKRRQMAEGIDVARLGRLVRRKREKEGLSLFQLSHKIEVKVPTLSRIERGASKDLESATLLALSAWLGQDWQDLREQKPKLVVRRGKTIEETPDIVDVYLRADKNLNRDTAEALSTLFRTAYENLLKTYKKG